MEQGLLKPNPKGIYYAQARMYDPATGRFWGVDAMRSEMPGWNAYHYTLNHPVRFVDPDGMMPQCCNPVNRAWRTGENMFNTAVNKVAATTDAIVSGVHLAGRVAYATTAEAMIDGFNQSSGSLAMTAEGIQNGDISQSLEGIQATLDATADFAGGIETASVLALPITGGGSLSTLLVSGGIARVSDIGAKLVEGVKITIGGATLSSTISRAAWTGVNSSTVGRIPSKHQYGREFNDETVKQASSTLEEILE